VLARLFQLLAEVAWKATDQDQRRSVAEQLGRCRVTTDAQPFDAAERVLLGRLADQVIQALAGRWPHSA
jgi:hypothetical protein